MMASTIWSRRAKGLQAPETWCRLTLAARHSASGCSPALAAALALTQVLPLP